MVYIKLIPEGMFSDDIVEWKPKSQCVSPHDATFLNPLKERNYYYAFFTDPPYLHISIASQKPCIITLSPTDCEDEFSLVSTFAEKRFMLAETYVPKNGQIGLLSGELKARSCLVYLSNPNIPYGCLIENSKIIDITEKTNALVAMDTTFETFHESTEAGIFNEESLDVFNENVVLIKRLHLFLGLYSYPLYVIYTKSRHFFETLSLIAGREKLNCNGYVSLYLSFLEKARTFDKLKKIRKELLEKKKKTIQVLRNEGMEPYDCGAPYFVVCTGDKDLSRFQQILHYEKINLALSKNKNLFLAWPKV